MIRALAALVGLAATPAVAATTWVTVNTVSTGDQDSPAIATNRNGYVAVAWRDDRDSGNPDDTVHSEVFLRLFRDGVPLYEIKLSAGGTSGVSWRHISPDVGLDDRGNAVVVWSDDPDGNGVYNVPYRVVSPAGAVLGSGRANAGTAGQQVWPRVAVDPDGTPNQPSAVAFTVAWEDIQGSNPATVKAAGFTNVTTKAYEVTASQTTGAHHRPDVAVSAAGDALVVWDEDADANGSFNIGLTRLAKANGAIVLSRRAANANGGGQQQRAAVAANFNGDFSVAWESDHTGSAGVWARSYTAAGAPRHTDVEVAPGGNAASIGIDDQAAVVVAWTAASPDTWVRGLNADGNGTGRLPAQQASQLTAGRQEQIVVAVSAWAEVAVAYTDDNDGNSFDQVLLGLGLSNVTGQALMDRVLY